MSIPPSPYGQPTPVQSIPYGTGAAAGQSDWQTYYLASRDNDHLKLLSLFHYIIGGLTIAFSSFFIFYILMGVMFLNGAPGMAPTATPTPTPAPTMAAPPTTMPGASGAINYSYTTTVVPPYTSSGGSASTSSSGFVVSSGSPTTPPPMIGWFFVGFGSAMVGLGWLLGIATIVSGVMIKRRRRKVFSLIVAGLNCLSVPIGTILGVFTFIVLNRQSIATQYAQPEGYAPPPAPPQG